MLSYVYLTLGFVLLTGSVQAQPLGAMVDSSSGSQFIQSVRHHHHHHRYHHHRWHGDDVWVPAWRDGVPDWRNDDDGYYDYYGNWHYYGNRLYRGDRYRDRDDAKICLDGIGCVRFN